MNGGIMLFDKILFPTDFSDVSKKSLESLKHLKEYRGKHVILLHVIHQRIIDSLSIHSSKIDVDEFQEDLRINALRQMTHMRDELSGLGFTVKLKIRIGLPLREILKTEEEEDPSMIIIGSHGKSNLHEMLIGSVSEKVIRLSKKPVLVIKR